MKHSLLISLLLALSIAGYSQTQWEFGPAFGTGISDVSRNTNDFDKYKVLLGYHAGVEVQNQINRQVIFRSQLRFASAGSAIERYSSQSNYQGRDAIRVNYLEVPVQLSFDFGEPNGFLLTLGLHGSLGVGGRGKIEASNGEVTKQQIVYQRSESSDPDVLDYKPFNTGWRLGMGIKKENVIFDILIASTLEDTPRKPFVITIKGGVSIMIN